MKKIHKNLLIIFAVLIALVYTVILFTSMNGFSEAKTGFSKQANQSDSVSQADSAGSYTPVAEDVYGEKYIKNNTIKSEVDEKDFDYSVLKVKEIADGTNSFIVDEQISTKKRDNKTYYTASFAIKVPVENYTIAVLQIKNIGEVISFDETVDDVSTEHATKEMELESLKKQLQEYRQEKINTSDQERLFELTNLISNIEKQIRLKQQNLEELTVNTNYSTINYSLYEEGYIKDNKNNNMFNIFKSSGKILLYIVLALLPWALLAILIIYITRKTSKKK